MFEKQAFLIIHIFMKIPNWILKIPVLQKTDLF